MGVDRIILSPPVVVSRREVFTGLACGMLLMRSSWVSAALLDQLDPHLYFAQMKRVLQNMRDAGEPLSLEHESQLKSLVGSSVAEDVKTAERILAEYTLLQVRLDSRGVGRTVLGDAKRELIEQGWRSFLVRIENPHGFQRQVFFDPNTLSGSVVPEGETSTRLSLGTETHYLEQTRVAEPVDIANRWLGYRFFAQFPLTTTLSGRPVEYQILQLYSRDRGRKTAYLDVQAVGVPFILVYGAKNGRETSFDCLPSRDVALVIKDWDGAGTTASIVVRDKMRRLYPAPSHRLEPDFDFQPQIYRADGESVRLPVGEYFVDFWRGPEYLKQTQQLVVADSDTSPQLLTRLQRWMNAAALGWYPGDTHLHAAGCAHYEVPTMGVTPETMLRHVRGEGLNVGNVLTWGPGYYYQKRFFTGHIHKPTNILPLPAFQEANNTSLEPQKTPHDQESMVRWDVEVSGFPSSHSGHLVLLNLREQSFPGVDRLEEWPSWNLPILEWAKAQGAIVGYAHCGLMVESNDLPNYELPAFDLVGANEFVVDVTHDAVDFLAGGSVQPSAELNLWYHALNCGFRTTMVGETDFPCLWERAGNGRTYVGLDRPPTGDDGFAAWVDGIKQGRLYFGDGRSHFIDFRVDGYAVGGNEVPLSRPGKVTVTARIAARLEEVPIAAVDDNGMPAYSFWHLEHARIRGTRTVLLEVVVNGKVAAVRNFPADGVLRDFTADVEITQSSWIAMRFLASGHTAPIFVSVDRQPIRASKRSAQWCLDCLDPLLKEKAPRIRPAERQQAIAAYDHARMVYKRILSECTQA
jgi:hypothetical protein